MRDTPPCPPTPLAVETPLFLPIEPTPTPTTIADEGYGGVGKMVPVLPRVHGGQGLVPLEGTGETLINSHPNNTRYQHTLTTHTINIRLINTAYQHYFFNTRSTLSTHL